MGKRDLLKRLNDGMVICAEDFLFEAERRGYLASGEFVPELSFDSFNQGAIFLKGCCNIMPIHIESLFLKMNSINH